jgi:plastocyanin
MVKLAGSPPRPPTVPVPRHRDVCGEEKASEALVLGESQAVKGSVVLVEGVARGKKESGDVVVDTRHCAFVAHVTAAMPGERVRVKNSDTIVHNTHGMLGKATLFNVALPGKDQTIDITKRLTRPGVVHVVCDAHPHMQAWLVLHDSPYFAVTDERGAFRIDEIPPGTYRVTMWHEGFRARGVDKDGRLAYGEPRTVTRQVTIGARAQVALDFELR